MKGYCNKCGFFGECSSNGSHPNPSGATCNYLAAPCTNEKKSPGPDLIRGMTQLRDELKDRK